MGQASVQTAFLAYPGDGAATRVGVDGAAALEPFGGHLRQLVQGLQALAAAGPDQAVVLACLAEHAAKVCSASVIIARNVDGPRSNDGSVDQPWVTAATARTFAGQDELLQGIASLADQACEVKAIMAGSSASLGVTYALGNRGFLGLAVLPVPGVEPRTVVVLVGGDVFGSAEIELVEQLTVGAASRLRSAAAWEDGQAATRRLRAAMDAAVEGHTVYDPVLNGQGHLVDLRNAYLNPAGAALRGVDPDQWVGNSLLAAAAREGNTGVAQAYLQVGRTGVPWSARPRITTGRGTRAFAVSVVATGPPPSGVMVSFRDIEEETRAEQALAAAVRMLDDTQALAGIGSWEWDIPAGQLSFSAGMTLLCGGAPVPSVTTSAAFRALIHPDDRAAYERELAAAVRAGGRQAVQYRLCAPGHPVRRIAGWAHIELDDAGQAVRAVGGAQDVTEQVEREQALVSSEEQFRVVLANSPIGLAIVGLDGRWLQVSRALAEMTGYTQDQLLGLTFRDLTHPEDQAASQALATDLLTAESDNFALDKRYLRADGSTMWVALHVALVRHPDGTPRHFIAQIMDITDRQAASQALAVQASTDPLTGLANRRAWEQGLLNRLDPVLAGHTTLTVAILDLDRFKTYNDTFGHPAGDRLLIEATAAWTAHLRATWPQALLARLGGEEFGLAVPDADAHDARALLAELLAVTPRGQTASAGITLATATDDPTTVMTRADAALYAAKHQGRNRYQLLLEG